MPNTTGIFQDFWKSAVSGDRVPKSLSAPYLGALLGHINATPRGGNALPFSPQPWSNLELPIKTKFLGNLAIYPNLLNASPSKNCVNFLNLKISAKSEDNSFPLRFLPLRSGGAPGNNKTNGRRLRLSENIRKVNICGEFEVNIYLPVLFSFRVSSI